ncbi:MAG TPA: ATP-binding protein, partial [Acidimicrobiales bacterium]|nr:ATP-binding protein [Acidimicrobiales bacterium]
RRVSANELERLVPSIMGSYANRRVLGIPTDCANPTEAQQRLAGHLAHDLNNLLGVIISYNSFVRRGIIDSTELVDQCGQRWDEVLSDVGKIDEASDIIGALLRNLSVFAGREISMRVEVSPYNVLRNYLNDLDWDAYPGVSIKAQADHSIRNIEGDPKHVELMFSCLITNALEAVISEGEIIVEIMDRDLDLESAGTWGLNQPGSFVSIRVSDTGRGIQGCDIERLIEPFFSSKPRSIATGMGMAVVYGIVSASGGRIRIDSEPGKGTCVEVLFPS